jgi:hypothetical protein
MVATASVIRARNSSKLAGGGTKIFPTQEIQGVLIQAIVVAKQSFHYLQPKQPL